MSKNGRSQTAAGPTRAAKPRAALHTPNFTLYAAAASTKKRGLTTAFAVRAGTATVRNRVKRQAREQFRMRKDRLPEGVGVIIRERGPLAALTRRAARQQLGELFERLCAGDLVRQARERAKP